MEHEDTGASPGRATPPPGATATAADPPGGTAPGDAVSTPPLPAVARRSARAARRRAPLGVDLALLGVVGVLLIGAIAAGAGILYRTFYSPSAFVERYVSLLAEGRASEALAVPGVGVDSAQLEAAGLAPDASDALLRPAALAEISDVHVVSEVAHDDVFDVTVAYSAGGHDTTSMFKVERYGSIGVAPTWRFAHSPLAVMSLQVIGSMVFEVNGFSIDKRQVSPDGVDADPAAPVALLAFTPGVYSVAVDTAISQTPGVVVVSDAPRTTVPVAITAEPTAEFVAAVQERVEQFLSECATQQVLQPTACPFGHFVQDRIDSDPVWSIGIQPDVTVEPDGAGWRIPPTDAVAHLSVDVRSLFDGEVTRLDQDVPFVVTGKITVQPGGAVSILVGGPDTP
ncbi:hypothetical protein AB1K54_09500 [Microbacterium sp. BWT-B31]|uniref:hypothetical protein n=1 Tax=Microbacterium sp. BWT-B31 TaxID=3232072 RepID=UPI003528C1D6